MIERVRNARPLTRIAVGLYGADVAIVLRVLISHAGRTPKAIGLGVAGVLAFIVDPLFLRYLRGKVASPVEPDRAQASQQ